ncbi:MAG: ADP-ribosylglycohydrolase family protein [Eubacteriales bacterium]
MIRFNYESLKDRIYACWIGKNIGGTMGTPYEGGRQLLDIKGFVTEPGVVLPNDDLDLQLVWLIACEQNGPWHLDSHTLAEYWLGYISPNWNEYGIGKSNLRLGLLPPLSGDYENDWKHSNGAWIRTEVWACMAPGAPDVALRYSCEDASVDHGMGEGTYAAIFVAAVESAAFVEHDIRALIRIGLSKIPEDCRVARSVKLVCDCYDNGVSWKECREKVVEDSADLGWFEAPANVAYVILGLLYGEGDFKQSMIYAINCGDDTDCTGATIGSIMGILGGTAYIPQDWKQHIGDTITTVSVDKGVLWGVAKDCVELTNRVMRQIPVMLQANNIGIDIHAAENKADEADVEKMYGGAVAADLCARPSRSFDMPFPLFTARVIFDDDPTVAANGSVRMRILFKNGQNCRFPRHLNLSWYLPEGWSVEGCKKEVYLPHTRPSIASEPHTAKEISFIVHAGDKVDFQNRLVLCADCIGYPTPALIPITILG